MTPVRLARLVFALIRGGGRRGWARLGLMTGGIAVALCFTAVALSYPMIVDSRAERAAARIAVQAPDAGPRPFLYWEVDDFVGDRRWMRVLLSGAPGAPLPPGLSGFPRPGESVVSPALLEASHHSPSLAQRLGQVVGLIGPQGLAGPDEYVSYSGLPADLRSHAPAGIRYGASLSDVPDRPSPTILTGEVLLLVAGPAALFLLTAARLSAATRARRTAALRLLGMTQRELLIVVWAEAALAGVAGSVLGLSLFAAVMPHLGRWGALGIGWYPADARLSPSTSLVITLGIVMLTAFVAGRGMRAVLANPTAARRDGESVATSSLRFAPIVAGVVLLAGFAALANDHVHRTYGPETVYLVIAGAVLAVGGLLWTLTTLVRALAGWLARRTHRLDVRLASRRVQYETSSVTRVASALVVLVVVTVAGQAVLRSIALAAGAGRISQSAKIAVQGLPASQRAQLLSAPARGHLVADVGDLDAPAPQVRTPSTSAAPIAAPTGATASGDTTAPTSATAQLPQASSGDLTGQPGDQSAAALVSVKYVGCATLRTWTGQPLTDCQDGHAYRIEDADPTAPRNRVQANAAIHLTTSTGDTTTMTAPAATLTIPRLPEADAVSQDDVLVTTDTGPPGGLSDQATVQLLLSPSGQAMDILQAWIAQAAPAAQLQPDRDIFGIEMFRIHRGAIDLALTIAFLLGILTFAVASIDRAHERRSAVAALAVLGTPSGLLRRTQAAQLAMTLGIGLATAAITAVLAAHDYLIVADPQQGPSWEPAIWGLGMALVVTVTGLVSALVVPGANPAVEDLRRE